MSKLQWRNLWAGLAFTSPFLLGFLALTLYPLFASFYYSFTSYKILTPPQWIGLGNYTQMVRDELFWTAISNTLLYTAMAVPAQLVVAFALALALNAKIRGLTIYRTLFYLPSLVPLVAVSILWLWLFHTRFGLINVALQAIGLPRLGWLTNPTLAKPSLVLMSLWGIGPTIVIYLAGLQDVPQQLYEAAELDGASWLQKIRFVTLPMMTPVILFTLIIGLIDSFQYFTQVYIMTSGGPVNATLMYVIYLYDNAFRYIEMGYASGLAWILFLVVLLCTLLILRTSARWVYYGGETQ
ncbi:MAG: sugar ABC transporter permease [Caldilineaceae bacterium]